MKKSRIRLAAITALAAALALSGCLDRRQEGGGEWAPLGKDEKASLKVVYWSEQQFNSDYGMLFASRFPDIEIEVVDRQAIYKDTNLPREQALEQFIEQQRPDVLFLFDEYAGLAQAGKLKELDTVIEQDRFDLTGYHPAVQSFLRFEGDGKLYGLSHEFISEALYYNIDLFEKYNVEPPRDSMSWEEVFELAKRFPAEGDEEDRIYGLAIDSFESPLFSLVIKIAAAENLGYLNPEGTEVQIRSDRWRKTLESLTAVVKSGAFYLPGPEEANKPFRTLEDDLFIMGKAAMTVNSTSVIRNLSFAKDQLKDVEPVDWGVVTAPVDPNNRTQSGAYSSGPVFAIRAQSGNSRAAWELIKFANSEEYARLRAKSSPGTLFSRTAMIEPYDGREMSAFYKLEPKSDLARSAYPATNAEYEILDAIVKELEAVADDRMTLDEAIANIEEAGEAAIAQARSDKDQQGD
ncbi:ABC transporter substrate-binding protein [Paenibacillaceae bacterium WGS1546]|uniref:ABC transporter substrate-binding protein n=1 Tax=Cohnella sp. WGS1546 TaxID=3366810 RepID=UPI00372D7153